MSHWHRFLLLAGMLAALSPMAKAHIVLSQTHFEAGANFAAFFQVEHGCDTSPTTVLRVEIPDDVIVLDAPAKPGWKVEVQRVRLAKPVVTERGEITERVTSVTWRGKLDPKERDRFGLFVKLPQRAGPLYFPTVQQCEKGENRWTGIPAPNQAWRDLPRPAPVVELVAASAPTMFMAGQIMVNLPWAPATPPGAKTAAGYLTIMNHGTTADTLVGGSTPAAVSLSVHRLTMTNGVMSMRPAPDGLTIPPGATVELKPDGYHLMLSGLKAPLKEGSHIPATLTFAKAGSVRVEFAVGRVGASLPAEH